jgi:ubiquinone/menaquinone biosynthesis C-methylase UbiE
MKPVVDPEGVEISHLISACQPEGKKIVEIGCGHGSLTYQYASQPSLIVGIDPAYSELVLARDDQPASAGKVGFLSAKGEGIPLPAQFFDIALFSSSL